jgi:hypothetical protein
MIKSFKHHDFIKTIYFSIILIVLLYIYNFNEQGADYWIIWFCLLIFYYYFFNAIRKPIVLYSGIKTYFKIELFFLLFYFLLFFKPYQLYVLGLNDIKQNFFIVNTYWQYTNVSIVACTIGLLAFMKGFNGEIRLRKTEVIKHSFYQYNNLFSLIFTLLIICIIIFSVTGLKAYLFQAYIGSDTGDTTTNGIYFIISVLMLFLSSYSVLLYHKYNKIKYLYLFVSVLYCLTLLFSGDRNVFFIIAISFLATYYTFIKKIKLIPIAIYVFSAIFLYQIIEVSRKSNDRGLAFIEVLQEQFKEPKQSDLLDKSSFSITTNATRVSFGLVPKQKDFFYGKFKLIGIAGIIPYSRALFVDPKDKFKSSVDLLVLGSGTTWSVGSSIIADIYVDFGIIGVIILMFLLGYFAKFIKTKLLHNENSIKWSVLYIITLSLYSQLPRYSFDFIVRYIAWSFLIFWIFEKANNNKIFNK